MSLETQEGSGKCSRRGFLIIAGLSVVEAALVACGQAPKPLPTVAHISKGPYPLTEEFDGSLTDQRIDLLQHPFVREVRFSFDSIRAGGSLVLDATFRQDNEFRLVTEERDNISEGPGLIYARSTREKAGMARKYPVIRFIPSEEYLISLGFKLPGENCLKTYRDMLTYYITRDKSGNLHGRFEGLRTFDPKAPSFKPRDAEAQGYWDEDCLT